MTLRCPRCREFDLDEITVGDVLIDRCPRCAGLWFDHAELSEIAGPRPKLKALETVIPEAGASDAGMGCPRCEGVMLRRVALEGDERRYALLRCASCMGTWMDRGELRDEEDPRLIGILKAYAEKLL
jgi:Zn-finger nucleic acid-binding protein